jgi:hypothetical protein
MVPETPFFRRAIFESGNTPSPRFIKSFAPKNFEFPERKIHHHGVESVTPSLRKFDLGPLLRLVHSENSAKRLKSGPQGTRRGKSVSTLFVDVDKCLGLLLWRLIGWLLGRGQKYNQFGDQRPAITVAVAKYRHRLARP